ncbi:fumarylacetoacetate hydrolase family protein [Derxia gummosa]|uniref:Fumarylacetoacetate hydrolase family protein n=1 Tax=Derxia gummosa DSM 723 TaxID=1121388 RepID=A0A8B6X376_9BURK|nr:fumarylacetoacetate hydrolase family protein [Derxia gummosa]
MKLLRFGPPGEERPGLLDRDGVMRDLSSVVGDIAGAALSPSGLARIAGIDTSHLPLVPADARLGPPVAGVGKFIGIGLNYSDHARESGMAEPKEPIVFMKAVSCIGGPDDDVIVPRGSTRLDWEVELGVVIGSRAQYVAPEAALGHVAGYVLVNDVSERAFQLDRGGLWDKGKGCDSFGPIGPWLVTRDELPDPQALDLWLDVNGRRMQSGSTRDMIFGVAELVSYVSQFMTLLPGDVIATGTPAGVGMGRQPPQYLRPGDEIRLGIGGLGEQRQIVVTAGAARQP